MTQLGRDFKAPPQRARSQWLKIELLHSFGVEFEVPVMEAGGPGVRPDRLNRAVAFLVSLGFERSAVEERLAQLRRGRSASK